jgi:ABC-type nitrate/sulfonate/bicarbonate transport system substrate-binding protein
VDRNIDKVSFPYRASSHLALLHVISESGSWEKHGLDVNYDYQISSTDAHRLVPTGEVEFVGGNHVSTYGHRARGDSWVYLGQTMNYVYPKLVVRADSGINSLADLRGKKFGTRGAHPSLNDWLLLKQRGLDCDRDDYDFANQTKVKIGSMDEAEPGSKAKAPPLWHLVRDGDVDAALLMPPASLVAEAAGLKLIDVDPMPMIWFTTVSSSLEFVQKHPNLVERFLKGIIEGIHFFKTQPEKSIKIIEERYKREGQLNFAQASFTYHTMKDYLEPKLYPTMAAISNVYEEAKRKDKDAERINPMELWDLHHIRRLDDIGFVRNLYADHKNHVHKDANDPDYQREQAAAHEKMIAEIKACGHPVGEHCDCE